jgi:hypothetical protein
MTHGCFYRVAANGQSAPEYLPQIGLDAHATILATNSRTVITQTFVNPSSSKAISEVFYSFPLYESSTIVGFTCHVGDTVIEGVVEPKRKAKEIYQEAKSKGKTAAILDRSLNAADVFSTRVGNVPAGGTVLVEITLIQELAQDAKTDGIRYTIPATIGSRYGSGSNISDPPQGILVKTAIKVDVVMEKGSNIRNVRSPSHPIQVDLGRTSNLPESTFETCYALVQLHENVLIEKDFVITVKADKQDLPFAFLETHPTLPNQKALMVSLVPKFSLPPDSSEIIFVIDRSGSMHDKIPTLRSALELFLKSLPLGMPFNLISFGDRHEALWPRSKVSSKESLGEALKYTKTIEADLGGTEMMCGLQAAVANRYEDKVLEVLVLTDGAVWNQSQVFDLVNQANQNNSARFFTLGLGNLVSHSLINGISRAGKGFSQTVLNNEDLNKTVVRMLKGALMPRLHDSKLDLGVSQLEEDFVEVELPEHDEVDPEPSAKPISLFDQNYKEQEDVRDLRDPLPQLVPPSILQAPTDLPAFFPFIRSNIYILLSQSLESFPERITLRANSKHGPLELEIPVQVIGRGQTLHQLAAKKAVTELEESRGWIFSAKEPEGELIKTKWESRVNELVQQECERLGVKFQVAGKHCSFVAVNDETPIDFENDKETVPVCKFKYGANYKITGLQVDRRVTTSGIQGAKMKRAKNSAATPCCEIDAGVDEPESDDDMGLYSPMALPSSIKGPRYHPTVPAYSPTSPAYAPTSPFASTPAGHNPTGLISGMYDPAFTTPSFSPTRPAYSPTVANPAASPGYSPMSPKYAPFPSLDIDEEEKEEEEDESTGSTIALPLNKIISAQTFEGYWEMNDQLFQIMGLDPNTTRAKIQSDYESVKLGKEGQVSALEKWFDLLATCLACQFLEKKETESKDVWELVKSKADSWVQTELDAMGPTDRGLAIKLIDELRWYF